jgi:hypothetical protein
MNIKLHARVLKFMARVGLMAHGNLAAIVQPQEWLFKQVDDKAGSRCETAWAPSFI